MQVTVKDFFEMVSPSASLIIAAWIFLKFLETRHTTAYGFYRALVETHRDYANSDANQHSMVNQIKLCRHRCIQMQLANNIGIVAALLLILALCCSTLEIASTAIVFQVVGITATLLGLVLLISAAVCMILGQHPNFAAHFAARIRKALRKNGHKHTHAVVAQRETTAIQLETL